ncbi:hypothetical protein CPter291_4079 [Collimonas pratensis]|uniref:Uncharacterized protein n=1 Tax=Collimonas pratensis TaxID=279113 RepID=A0ABM5ZB17_9BURK|nr:hypothetical protein CPter291_4079 [Collimonas pratensis]
MYRFFESFLSKMAAKFRSISRATKNEMSLGDLYGDAWVVAAEIGGRRGRVIDFSDPLDQDLILGALNIRNVKKAEKNMRFAVRIDETHDVDGDEVSPWSNRLRAHETSDPLVLLLHREEMEREEDALVSSYSEYAAYIVALFQFKDDRLKLCEYLLIASVTLRSRMNKAETKVKVQSSLFDRRERIGSKFMPLPGQRYLTPATQQFENRQQLLGF